MSAVRQGIRDEVAGLAKVSILRDGHRCPGAQSLLAPSAFAHGELLVPV